MKEKENCNLCGKEFNFFDRQNDFTIHRKIEYGSIYDGCTVELHLCCDCLDALAEKCKIFPISEKGWSI